MIMKKHYIPYELAKELVNLGFKEKTFDVYSDGVQIGVNPEWHTPPTPKILWQQAFDWFLYTYKLHIIFDVDDWNKGRWTYKIVSLDKSIELDILHSSKYWIIKRCLESIQQSRLECLKQLIELIKQNEKV